MENSLQHNNSSTHSLASFVECPRDAMQGWKKFIKTEDKVRYINTLLKVGFNTIDFGSFVSPKAIPQMADTKDVLKKLKIENSISKLLAIVANTRGAEDAVTFDEITYVGFPFSISPTFQQRNTNSTLQESLQRVDEIQELCLKNKKELVVYLSMGFGNPYGDVYNEEILLHWANEMVQREIKIISLADTVGMATAQQIETALKTLIPYFAVALKAHLRNENNIPDFEKWAELDLEYINNWSLKKDFQLLLKTVPAVISGSGAK